MLSPASLPQEQMLNSTSIVTLYAGSAGAGKTYAMLLTALKFMLHPNSTGVIFRRTSTMIKAPGSIWHEAVNMYGSIFKDLKVRHRDLEIVFPNKSILKFSHMQHASNMYDHKGAQYSFVGYDEATDFDEEMITFMFSRMRNANVDYTPQMFLCTNPNYHSFLRKWIEDFYLNPIDGTPLEEKSNVERWFFVSGGKMLWYNTKEEAEAVHGTGDDNGVRTFRSIKAVVQDNKPLLRSNPSYISNLMSLGRVAQLIMLYGSWTAREESAGYFKRDWVGLVDKPASEIKGRVRSWDMAFSAVGEGKSSDPDFTAGVLMSKDKQNVYTIENVVKMRDRVHAVEKLIFDTAASDGTETIITIPQDPNAQAGAYARDLQRRLSEMGYTCRLMRPVKSKITRFAPFASLAESRFVSVVKADWNKDFFDELEVFDGSGKYHDDTVDACSDAFITLNKVVEIPNFTLPDMTQANKFANPFNF